MNTARCGFATFLAVQALCCFGARALAEGAPTPAEAAARAGVTPASLAIAGFTANDATTMLARLDAVVQLRENLAAAADAADEAGAAVTSYAERLRRGACDVENIEAYDLAVADFADGAAYIESRLDLIFAVALAGFEQEQIQLVARVGGQLHRRVPREFLVLEKTEAEWRAVEEALVAERRADRLGLELAEHHAELLDDVRTHPDVIDAAANLSGGLSAIQASFESEAE